MQAFIRTSVRNHIRTAPTSSAYARVSHTLPPIVSPWQSISVILPQSCASRPREFGTSHAAHFPRRMPRTRVIKEPSSTRTLASNTREESADTTIFALSTPQGKSAIAVVRISGPACLDIYRALCPSKPLPKPRHATLRALYSPTSSTPEVLDPGALILYFPAPRSITGEDILELHLHGGPAILRSVLSAIPKSPTPTSHSPIRYAEPGEFTRRAFLNERLSLPQIEALGDTLSATTEQQRKLSLRGSGTKLTDLYESWRKQLVEARGELEALIDFSEDQSFEVPPRELLAGVTRRVEGLRQRMKIFVENAVRGELLRGGISISLVGAPNVGKSSLLNRIVGREAVIVSREAGTTRDVVDLSVDLGGYVMVVGDTAGLRIDDIGGGGSGNVLGEIEREGIRRARKRVKEADVVVVVLAIDEDELSGELSLPIPSEVVEVVREAVEGERKEVIVCVNKMDLCQEIPPLPVYRLLQVDNFWRGIIKAKFPYLSDDAIVGISCHNSNASTSTATIRPLLTALTKLFCRMTSSSTASPEAEDSLAATTRQRLLVESCLQYLDWYLEMVGMDTDVSAEEVDGGIEAGTDAVLAAEELRSAAGCLGMITGKGEGSGDVEEVLGVVFEKFCVGK